MNLLNKFRNWLKNYNENQIAKKMTLLNEYSLKSIPFIDIEETRSGFRVIHKDIHKNE